MLALLLLGVPVQFVSFARDYFADYQKRSAYRLDSANMRATRRSDGFRLRISSMKASSSPARNRSTRFVSCGERSCAIDD